MRGRRFGGVLLAPPRAFGPETGGDGGGERAPVCEAGARVRGEGMGWSPASQRGRDVALTASLTSFDISDMWPKTQPR